MNTMNKGAAEAFLKSGEAKELLLKNMQDKDPTHWLLFVATYEVATDKGPEGEWFVLGVQRDTLEQRPGSVGLLRSNGGSVRIYASYVAQAGNAHQSDDGTWLWDMD